MRQAKTGTIEASTRQLQEHEERNITKMGPITRQYVAIHQARQPEGLESEIPTSNEIRKCQLLHEWREDVTREEVSDNERKFKNQERDTRFLG